MRLHVGFGRRLAGVGTSLCLGLSACGGGGGSGPAPVAMPAAVSILAPSHGDASLAIDFRSDLTAASGLNWRWQFGDGGSSTEPSPSYRYMRGGDFEVELVVSNTAEDRRTARTTVSVTNKAHVRAFICEGSDQSRWCWQRGVTFDFVIAQLAYVSRDVVWALTTSGQPLRSTNGGGTWGGAGPLPIWNGPAVNVRLAAGDRETAWVQNTSTGAFWRSTDGGRSWTALALPMEPPKPPFSLEWPGVQAYGGLRLQIGAAAVTYESVDAGTTWTTRVASPDTLLARRSAEFIVAPDGVVWRQGVSEACLATVCRSSDGGMTFSAVGQPLPVPIGGRVDTLTAGPDDELIFQGLDRYQAGPGVDTLAYFMQTYFLRSVDGGRSWSYLAGDGLPIRHCPGYFCSGFLRPYTLRSAGGGVVWLDAGDGVLYRSLDGGSTWALGEPSQAAGGSLIAAFAKDTVVKSSGNALWISTDRGVNWSQGASLSGQSSATSPAINSAAGIGPQGLIALSSARMLRSDDAGRTWSEWPLGAIGEATGLSFPTPGRGWFVVDRRALWLTQVGAVTRAPLWTAPTAWPANDPDNTGAPYIARVRFRTDSDGVLVLSPTIGGASALLASADGGETWQERGRAAVPELGDVIALDDERMALAGRTCLPRGGDTPQCYARVFLSLDGGRTWSLVFETQSQFQMPRRLAMQPQTDTLWLVGSGGLLARSADRGQTWQPVKPAWDSSVDALRFPPYSTEPLIGLNGIGFGDGRNGWLVGQGGLVYGTRDGGASWMMQRPYTPNGFGLNALVIADPKTAWALGEGGVVLSTGTGGW